MRRPFTDQSKNPNIIGKEELYSIFQAWNLGMSPITYIENKQLPLVEKLKLPIWEFLCAIYVAEPYKKTK
jgi:hypothetical protein